MNAEPLQLFWTFVPFIIVLFVIGLYCILVTYNLIRALIGVELLIKAVTLLLISVGYVTGHIALTQALVITLIVIEVVLIAIGVGIVLGVHSNTKSLNVTKLRNLKG
jgi:NADH:ubiquinone oxidoreductase subunit K